jgi:orotate phosphoribosyltransferase
LGGLYARAPKASSQFADFFQVLATVRSAAYLRRARLWESPVTDDEVLAEFRAAEALLEGHFILSSGLRSSRYLQCARVLADPRRAERLAIALVARIPTGIREAVEVVVSPAMGGIIIGHEMGRALGRDALFLERPDGVFGLRRGFRLEPGQKVLMVEDVVTTGLSSREAIEAVRREGGVVIAEASLVDRSNGAADLGVPFFPLIQLAVPSYQVDALPPALAAIPAIKPGSRKEAA